MHTHDKGMYMCDKAGCLHRHIHVTKGTIHTHTHTHDKAEAIRTRDTVDCHCTHMTKPGVTRT